MRLMDYDELRGTLQSPESVSFFEDRDYVTETFPDEPKFVVLAKFNLVDTRLKDIRLTS